MFSVQLLEMKITRITYFFLRATRLLCPIPFTLITFNFRLKKPALIHKDCCKQSNIVFIQKNPTICNSLSKFIIPYLNEAQHVSGDTPPIIRSLKLHLQPLVLHTWKVVGRVVTGRCQVEYESVQTASSRTLPDSVQ
jgi:hypothetical protein